MSRWDNHPAEEESSFISMADMMVGLLLIFIILLTYFVLQSREDIAAAEQVKKTERAAVEARGIVLDKIRERIDNENIEFDNTTGTIRFSEQVLTFRSGAFDIPDGALDVLSDLALALRETLPCLSHLAAPSEIGLDCSWLEQEFSSGRVQQLDLGTLSQYRPDNAPPLIWIDGVFIEGHTDCTLFNDAEPDFRNWVLGAQRAAKTYLYLTDLQPELGQIFSKDPGSPLTAASAYRILGVASYADRRPAREFGRAEYPEDHRNEPNPRQACERLDRMERLAGPGDKPQNRLNRRIDIRIVMGWTSLEGTEG